MQWVDCLQGEMSRNGVFDYCLSVETAETVRISLCRYGLAL